MALNYNSSQMFVFCWFLVIGGTLALEDMVGGQSMDVNERLQRLEMQLSKLQLDVTSMETILGEILIGLNADPDDQVQNLQNFYEVKRSGGNSNNNNMPSFLGSRGKKMVFLGSRGKRIFAKRLAFLGSRGRRGGPPSFYGSRG